MRVRTLASGEVVNPVTTSPEERIAELGIEMPPAPQPLGAYTETVQSGRLLFVAGTIPTWAGKPKYTGTLGQEIGLDAGQQAARMAALNALAAARQHLGSLDRVTQVLKTEVWLVTTDDYVPLQPKIADGASQVLFEIFGEKGRSVRKLLGIASIPLHAPLAVELLLEVQE
jgi:enamine deaminase RidA (YjgF/YER057c/UK114 family)